MVRKITVPANGPHFSRSSSWRATVSEVHGVRLNCKSNKQPAHGKGSWYRSRFQHILTPCELYLL